MKYLYNGVLTEFETSNIKLLLQSYPHVLEFAFKPHDWANWSNKRLMEFTVVDEETGSERQTQRYAILPVSHSVFFFFASSRDYDLVSEKYLNCLVSKKPFQTEF